MGGLVLLWLWIVGAVLYFVPGLVAVARGHRSSLAIVVLNVLLGWTVLGWIGALVWACTVSEDPRRDGQ